MNKQQLTYVHAQNANLDFHSEKRLFKSLLVDITFVVVFCVII